jgi:hypothetical protein
VSLCSLFIDNTYPGLSDLHVGLGQSSSEELFALKFVHHTHVNEIEKEVLFQAVGHPFLVQLHAYFRTRVNCSFMHSVTMH